MAGLLARKLIFFVRIRLQRLLRSGLGTGASSSLSGPRQPSSQRASRRAWHGLVVVCRSPAAFFAAGFAAGLAQGASSSLSESGSLLRSRLRGGLGTGRVVVAVGVHGGLLRSWLRGGLGTGLVVVAVGVHGSLLRSGSRRLGTGRVVVAVGVHGSLLRSGLRGGLGTGACRRCQVRQPLRGWLVRAWHRARRVAVGVHSSLLRSGLRGGLGTGASSSLSESTATFFAAGFAADLARGASSSLSAAAIDFQQRFSAMLGNSLAVQPSLRPIDRRGEAFTACQTLFWKY